MRRLAFVSTLCSLSLLAISACKPDDGTQDQGDGDASSTDDPETVGGDGDPGDGDPGDAPRPNWHEDIAVLVTENCVGRHQAGGIAPFSMQTYEETAPWSAVMADACEARTMPPWHAATTAVCQPVFPYEGDPSLSDAQIEMLREWADLGAPEGDPADAAPLPAPPDLDLANPSVTVVMGSPVEVEAEGSTLDFFHCLSFDPGNDQDVYVDGLQVVQGNSSILHHVLMYLDTSAESASWPGGVKQDCGGGSGLSGSAQLVAAWVPGSAPLEPPEGVSVTLPAGARIVYNVHYHATGAGVETDDGTGLALRWSDQPSTYQSLFVLIGAPGIGIPLTGLLHVPPGESGHVEEFEWPVEYNGQSIPDWLDVRLWTAANHMHKVGVDMRVWIEHGDGSEDCLVHTPNWDFNWQRFYKYDVPIEQGLKIQAGDVVHVRCEYDNTLDNPAVVEALAEVGLENPVDVFVGEGTLDEMCLTALGVGYSF